MRVVVRRHALLVSVGATELLEDGREEPPGCRRETLLARVVVAEVLEQRQLVLLVHELDEHRAALPPLLGAQQECTPLDGDLAPTIAPVPEGASQEAIDDLVVRIRQGGHDHGQRDAQLREEVLVVRRPADDARVRVVSPGIFVGETGLRHSRVPLPHGIGRPANEARRAVSPGVGGGSNREGPLEAGPSRRISRWRVERGAGRTLRESIRPCSHSAGDDPSARVAPSPEPPPPDPAL